MVFLEEQSEDISLVHQEWHKTSSPDFWMQSLHKISLATDAQ
jgi:hypothetical protein